MQAQSDYHAECAMLCTAADQLNAPTATINPAISAGSFFYICQYQKVLNPFDITIDQWEILIVLCMHGKCLSMITLSVLVIMSE